MKLIKAFTHFVESVLNRALWLVRHSPIANFEPIRLHILVVNKKVYAKLAYLCVLSFLYFHPNSKFQIYHDLATGKSLKLRFFLLSVFKRNRVEFVALPKIDEWQMHKLNIIMSLLNTSDFFLDCDLKWNGAISNLRKYYVTYFVKEKPFTCYKGLEEVMVNLPINSSEAVMRNTSVFSWGGINLDRERIEEFNSYVDELRARSKVLLGKSNVDINRIYEQVALSLIPELYSQPCTYVKEVDNQFDGSVCESSYYGATGGRFALWGNTSRISLLTRRI